MVTRLAALALTAAALAGAPGPARAWGTMGHRVVARIAEERLSPAARRMVREVAGRSLAAKEIASWADQQSDPVLRPWHYVNIPPGQAYDPDRDCREGQCVVEAIRRQAEALEFGQSALERADALRWLVHLVADVHQPLHATSKGRGGTAIAVRLPGRSTPDTLHRVWDVDVVSPLLLHGDVEGAAVVLARAAAPGDAARPAAEPASPIAWAEESARLAQTIDEELAAMPVRRGVTQLPRGYPVAQRARVEEVLRKAGTRLAALLDRIAAAREARGAREGTCR